MAAIILGVRISKTQQLSNWEAANLSESQIKYAATDAWVCETMYLKLMESEKHPLPPEEQPRPAGEKGGAKGTVDDKAIGDGQKKSSRSRRRKPRRRHRNQASTGGDNPVQATENKEQ